MDTGSSLIRGHLDWSPLNYSELFDFDFDLAMFREMASAKNLNLDFIEGLNRFLDVKGGGDLRLEAFADIVLDFGIDYSNDSFDVFLEEYDQGTGRGSQAAIGAKIAGTALDLQFETGPLSLGVADGTVQLGGNQNGFSTLDLKMNCGVNH